MTTKNVNVYRIVYSYTHTATGRVTANETLVAAYSPTEARVAFYRVYKTDAGEHRVSSTTLLSTVDLDTLF
jgi:hypothetical protein